MRNFLDDPRRRSGPLEEPERDRREGSRRHGRNWGGPDFERVRYGLEQERQVGAGGLEYRPAASLSVPRGGMCVERWAQSRERLQLYRSGFPPVDI